MGWIPKTELERLKREVAVERLAEARGVKLERHAAELLRADLPPEGLTTGKPPKLSMVPKLPGLLDASDDDQALLRRVVDYYLS